ncbi:hypothetical protein CYY_004472 [Polysphondylium violaceum]|uniref:Uncharacterized protein n=1 Tax=Polysphondylium violaceum TaxID=133409 RepID=A0A8J4PVC5_9MYCE|nr:hypothetical protein CYY_004472 [Polysphondylium violaceum]
MQEHETKSKSKLEDAKNLVKNVVDKCKQNPNYTGTATGLSASFGTIIVVPSLLQGIGFTTTGILSGSWAASAMAYLPVSLVATGQSIGALGTIFSAVSGTPIIISILAFGGAFGLATKLKIDRVNKKEQENKLNNQFSRKTIKSKL